MKTILMALALSALPATTGLAETWNVPPGADIQPYIDGASSGDTIQLAEGIYSISTTLTNDYKDLTIQGVSRDTTILDGNDLTRIMNLTGDVNLTDVKLINGRADYGGGLLVGNSSQLVMNDCIISDCTATGSLGGGAISAIVDTSLFATNCIFQNNRADGEPLSISYGGAIALDHLYAGRTYSLVSCSFIDNFSNGGGGGLFAIGEVSLVAGCAFTGNTSDLSGGGVNIDDGYFENTTFTDNISGSNGGGSSALNGTFVDCTYTRNISGNNGGGAYSKTDSIFEACTFIMNEAPKRFGGGLRIYSPDGGYVRNCLFESNSAIEGGGMHLQNADSERFTIETSTFLNNSAELGGGFGMRGSTVELIDCQISENDATSNGGGIWSDITNCYDALVSNGILCGNTVNGSTDGGFANFHPCYSWPDGEEPCLLEFCDQDNDGDGAEWCDDQCPEDPDKADPGSCGCGNPEIDLNDDGVIDCSTVHNRTKDTLHDSLRDALPGIDAGDEIALMDGAVAGDSGPIFLDAANVTFQLQDQLVIPDGMLLRAGPDTRFINEVEDASFSVAGQLVAPNANAISFQSFEVLGDGQFLQNESLVLVNETCLTSGSGRMFLNGDILASLVATTDSGENRIAGDTNVFSDYDNAGATIIQRGTLYIYGDLVNTGTLSGDVNNGLNGSEAPEPGDGFSIAGDYTVGAGASLVMPDPVWWLRVGGDLDIRIDDPERFVMAEATIELNGLSPEPTQTLEAMSEDRGAVDSGLDPDNYPVGSIRLRPGATVEVVNQHDNASGPGCEVIYADELVVPTGATLVTSGCPIYVRSASIDGSVSNPDDIVIIGDEPACPTDINGDGMVDGVDLAEVLGAWGSGAGAADINQDGLVDGTDLALLLGDWGSTCSE